MSPESLGDEEAILVFCAPALSLRASRSNLGLGPVIANAVKQSRDTFSEYLFLCIITLVSKKSKLFSGYNAGFTVSHHYRLVRF